MAAHGHSTPTLHDSHREELRRSGLTDETIAAIGFRSEDNPNSLTVLLNRRYPKKCGTALVIPFRSLNGEINGYCRVKPMTPRTDRNGRAIKYESPAGLGNRAFFPPGVLDTMQEVETELLVTEGEKKAAAATQFGFNCIGLVGVYGWKHGKGADRLIPDLEAFQWRGRQVRIAFDSDAETKPEVREAESRLAAQLQNRGARVKVVRLPDGPDGAKVGIDDFLVAHSPSDLRKLLDQAGDPDPVDAGTAKVTADAIDALPEARRFLSQTCSHSDGVALRFYRDTFHGWDGSRYRELTDNEMRARIVKYLDPVASHISKSVVSNIIAGVQAETILDSWCEPPRWLGAGKRQYIAMQNGLLDLDTLLAGKPDVLRPHSPLWFSTVALPYPFDAEAHCPTWLAFLQRNLEGDRERIDFLQEWTGYLLSHDTSMQKFVVLEGEGANGKSVYCAVLTAVLGAENVAHVPLEAFGARFQLTTTIGKLANVCAEVGELDRAAEGFLKAFTSGDRMTFDRKHKNPIEATPTARLVLATNNRPRFSDRSGGLWRRMVLVPWRVTIPEDERVVGMDKPEWWQATGELPGIFCWAVAGLHRLRQRKRFTESALCRDALAEYRTESNPARLFLQEHYREDLESWTQTAEVYAAYRKWCEAGGYMPLSERVFGREVYRVFPRAERRERNSAGERFYVYAGITGQG